MSVVKKAESSGGNESRKARIMVVEDHVFVRRAIVSLINNQPDLVCCGEEDSIVSTQINLAKYQPDLLLTDLRLKDGEALELVTALKFQFPDLIVMVLSHSDEALYAEKALRAGANGYLMKQEAAEEVLTALRTVLAGSVYLSPAMDKYRLRNPARFDFLRSRPVPHIPPSEGKTCPIDQSAPRD